MFDFEIPERFRRYIPLLAWLLVAAVIVVIPFKIIGLGYLPADDALRHTAKAVSGKPWPEILVVGSNFKIDHNIGWHAILGALHHALNWNAESLIIFSVAALFILVNGAMLPWLKRPEAWLAVLLAAMLISDLPQRFLLGRPFILTITVLMTLLFAVQKRKPDWRMLALFTVLIGASSLIHGVWYLWLLPVAGLFFAAQFQWSALIFAAWILGVGLAAALSGHPVDYLSQAVDMASSSVGQHLTQRTEAVELQPFEGNIVAVILVGALVLLRQFTKPAVSLSRNPAFWIMCGCWILGFRISRFWEDWGWPALMVWMATEVEALLVLKMAVDSFRRMLLVLILSLATFLSVTSDLGGRWTQSLFWQFLSVADHPELEGWMPGHGGILYSADMNIFYQTFFKNPNGDWRYMVGYEPAMMPAEDFAIYQKILLNGGDAKAYAPWVAKMKPADRLVIRGSSAQRPNIPELEWYYGVSGIWIGRLQQTVPAAK